MSNRRKAKLQPVHHWRFYLVLAGLVVLFSLLVYRLLMLQVLTGVEKGRDFLQTQGDVRTIRDEVIPAHRGMITDRNGEPLAVSSPVVSVWANPQQVEIDEVDWALLANRLGYDPKELKEKVLYYKNNKKQFMYLKRRMPPIKAQAALDLKNKGIKSRREYQRFYPSGEVTSHLIGFTNLANDEGLEGLELAYDDWLAGLPGKKKVLKGLQNKTISNISLLSEAKPGDDIKLSIDLRIQFLAYRELKKAVIKHRAKAASMVVVDVQTGEVLAMVNQPSFNPNNRRELKSASIRNRAFTDVFEPGSTVKPLTMLAALESGKYKPHSPIDTSPGYIKVGRKTLLDPVNYGVIDLTKIITKSSQVGTSKVALSLNEHDVRNVFYKVGLGQSTMTGFPGESTGVLPNRVRWTPMQRVAFSFGHGLSVTTAQLAQAYSVIAAKGVKRPLTLLKQDESVAGEQILNSDLAEQITQMLETVTKKGGTGTQARIPAYSVAGKTGTAHKVGRKGYDSSRYTAIFAGFSPASNPRLAAVVMVDEPSSGDVYYGGEVAAPIFSAVIGGGLRLLDVMPDAWEDFSKSSKKKIASH